MTKIKAVTDATFEAEVLQASGPVLVDFWAAWGGPCRAVAPVLQEVAERYAGRVRVAKLDVDENPKTAYRYGIRSIPTIALLSGGEIVDGIQGAAPLTFFTEMLESHLSGAGAAPG